MLDNIPAVMHFKLSGKIIFSKGVCEKAQSPITFRFGGIAISIIFVLAKAPSPIYSKLLGRVTFCKLLQLVKTFFPIYLQPS